MSFLWLTATNRTADLQMEKKEQTFSQQCQPEPIISVTFDKNNGSIYSDIGLVDPEFCSAQHADAQYTIHNTDGCES